ncbi:MAG: hypothetical protein ACFFDH_24855 [Promethearchaeota archaeon]
MEIANKDEEEKPDWKELRLIILAVLYTSIILMVWALVYSILKVSKIW